MAYARRSVSEDIRANRSWTADAVVDLASIPVKHGDEAYVTATGDNYTYYDGDGWLNRSVIDVVNGGTGHSSVKQRALLIGNLTSTLTELESLVGDNDRFLRSQGTTGNPQWEAVGEWTTVTHAAGNYTANGAMTWTVASGDQTEVAWTVIGNTMIVQWDLRTTTVGGTPNNELRITIPNSATVARRGQNSFAYLDNGVAGFGIAFAVVGNTYISLYTGMGAANWTAATDTTAVVGSIAFGI